MLPLRQHLYGRDTLLSESERAIETNRIVTIAGPAGVGKTSLLIELLWRKGSDFFFPLESANTEDEALRIIGASLGLHLGNSPEQQIELALEDLPAGTWIGLDNLEQVPMERLLERWLEGTNVHFVCSSRHVVSDAEFRIQVPGLPDDVGAKLLIERAKAKGVELDDSGVVSLVAALEGLPLSIELAAARTNVLSPSEIEKRIVSNVAMLKDASRTSSRQRSISLALDWSWDLLSEEEQRAFVFLGTLPVGVDFETFDATFDGGIDVLQSLVDKSLLRVSEQKGVRRFSPFVVMRSYCASRSTDLSDPTARFAEFARGRALQLKAAFSTDAVAALGRCSVDYENFRFAMQTVDDDAWLDLAGSLDAFLECVGPASERLPLLTERRIDDDAWRFHVAIVALEQGQLQLAESLEHEMANTPEAAFVRAKIAAANDHHEDAVTEGNAALKTDDAMVRARALGFLAWLEPENRSRYLADAVKIYEHHDARRQLSRARLNLGVALLSEGRTDEAVVEQSAAIEDAESLADAKLTVAGRTNRALLLHQLRKHDAALSDLEIATQVAESVGLFAELGTIRGNLGALLLNMGSHDRSHLELHAAIRLLERYNRPDAARYVRFAIATLLHETGATKAASDAYRLLLDEYEPGSARCEVSFLSSVFHMAAGDVSRAREVLVDARLHDHLQWRQLIDAWASRIGADDGAGDATLAADDTVIFATTHALALGEPLPTDWVVARLISQALGESVGKEVLKIDADGSWFEFRGERVEMGRRGAPKRLLLGFSRNQGDAFDVDALFEIGWPGQAIGVEAAHKRVYSAIRTLRRLGLEDALVTTDDGYCLDPNLMVQWE